MAEVEAQPSEDKKARKVPLGREDVLPEICQRLSRRILDKVRKHELVFFQTESHFFEDLTATSGIMKPEMSKDEKRAIIKENLIRINKNVPEGVYLPTNPSCTVLSIVETSGAPMQSAAKCPFRVTFNVIEESSIKDILKAQKKVADDPVFGAISEEKITRMSSIVGRHNRDTFDSNISGINGQYHNYEDEIFQSHKKIMNRTLSFNKNNRFSTMLTKKYDLPSKMMNKYNSNIGGSLMGPRSNNIVVPQNKPKIGSKYKGEDKVKQVSCIFKVFDDVRQDILAIKMVKLFKEIFNVFQLDLHLFPYNIICNRTGEDKNIGGIIECVPNTHSRDELGKDYDVNMYQYFVEKFGGENSDGFKKAQQNFIRSLAGYSVFSYIVQPKDRHNGNIMIDKLGNLVHIDFGFIFDWSPGGDMRFESADFKFTKEMIKILGGHKDANAYQLFVSKAIQGYLAVRKFARQICDLIFFSLHSGLPCFKTKSMKLLRKRFRLDLNECQAANHYRKIINNAHNKWTTKVYDQIQYLQNKISY